MRIFGPLLSWSTTAPVAPAFVNGVRDIVNGLYQPITSLLHHQRSESPLFKFSKTFPKTHPNSNEVQLTKTIFQRVGLLLNRNTTIAAHANHGVSFSQKNSKTFLHVVNLEDVGLFPKSQVKFPLNLQLPGETTEGLEESVEKIFNHVVEHLQTTSNPTSAFSVSFHQKAADSTPVLLQKLIFNQVSSRLNIGSNERCFAYSEIVPPDENTPTTVILRVLSLNH